MTKNLEGPRAAVVNGEAVDTDRQDVEARDPNGGVLLRRRKTPLELAMEAHGPVHQPAEWLVHPACADPPAHSGICTYRFADGTRWCFKCEVAWSP